MSYWDGTRWLPDRPVAPVRKAPRSRARDWLATIVMLAGLVIIVFPGNLSEAAGPKLTASPTAARPGEVLRVSGRGFPARGTVQLAWDGSVAGMPLARVNSAGTFASRLVVADSKPGQHTLTALTAETSFRARGTTDLATTRPIASVSVTVVASDGGQTPTPAPAPTSAPAVALLSATPTAEPTTEPTAVPTAPPPPPTVPTAGLPTIDPAYGTLFRKVFTDGTFGPFRVLTYPDDHIGGGGQYMTVYSRFSNGSRQASVHGGYLDLRATPRADGLWDAALVGTSQGGNGPTFGYGVYRFWLRFNAAPATWQAAWLYDTTSWSATEIDFPEMLENQSLTAHVLGQGAGAKYGIAKPSHLASVFHEYKIERRASFVAFSIDGVEVARVNGSMPGSKLAILLDSKVGFGWTAAGAPSGSTPDLTYLHVAAVTVDP